MNNELICNKGFDKTEIKNIIEWFLVNYGSCRTMYFINKVKYLGFKYATKMSISLSLNDLEIPPLKSNLLIDIQKTIKKYKIKNKLGLINKKIYFEKSHFLWNNINSLLNDEIIKNFKQKNILNPVYLMISSGARGNLSQIKQIIGIRGLMSNPKGEIVDLPIKTNLKEGLNPIEYFISCYGARKGLIDTALKTANSGYLTRRLVFVAQNVLIKQRDCKTKKGNLIHCKKDNKRNLLYTKENLVGRILCENILKNKKNIFSKGQDICNYVAKNLIQLERNVYVRSSLKCNLNIGICQVCYGWDLSTNKIVKIGDAIGILAAQSIGEPGTQLTMRTFHTGGIFTANTGKLIHSPANGETQNFNINATQKIKTIYNEKALFINKNKGVQVILKQNKKKAFRINIPKYSLLFIKPKEKIYEKEIIAEIPKWKNLISKTNFYATKTEFAGKSHLKINVKKNKELWILKGNLIQQTTLFQIILCKINFFNKYKKNYKILTIKNIMNLNKNIKNKKHKKHFEINRKDIKNILILNQKERKFLKYKKKITKFLKEEQKMTINLKNKNQGQIIQEKQKLIEIRKGELYKIRKEKLTTKNNVLLEKNSIILLNTLKTTKTKDIVEGLPKIEQLLEVKKNIITKNTLNNKLKTFFNIYLEKFNNKKAAKKAISKIQKILIEKIQKVYKEQGVNIAEKHIEIIIKQMTSKIIITENTNTNLLKGDILDSRKIEKINSTNNIKIKYEPLILGISRISLLNDSFISSASFQETVRILTKSAILGKLDWLKGLKENIILGNLIPVGTGKNAINQY